MDVTIAIRIQSHGLDQQGQPQLGHLGGPAVPTEQAVDVRPIGQRIDQAYAVTAVD